MPSLEGTYVPLKEVLAADMGEHARGSDIREVLKYEHAANEAFNALASGSPITSGLLENAQKTIVTGTRDEDTSAGSVRSTQVAIGSRRHRVGPTRAHATGDAPHCCALDLVRWIEAPDDRGRDPVVWAAMARYQFETLHPFTDGNWRVGQLLIVLQFMRRGLLSEPLLALSQYQDVMANVSASGEWGTWVTLVARAPAASACDAARRARQLHRVQQEYVDTLASSRVLARRKSDTSRSRRTSASAPKSPRARANPGCASSTQLDETSHPSPSAWRISG